MELDMEGELKKCRERTGGDIYEEQTSFDEQLGMKVYINPLSNWSLLYGRTASRLF